MKLPGKTVKETGRDVKIFSAKQVVAEHEMERDGGDLCGHW